MRGFGSVVMRAMAVLLFSISRASAEALLLPVPSHSIGSGEAVTSDEFVQKAFEVSAMAKANYLTTNDQLRGMQSSQFLVAGKPVPLAALQKAADVRKGKNTAAIFVADGIQIQGVLVPQSDGSAGETLHCKNPQTGLIVDALVRADGNLEVTAK